MTFYAKRKANLEMQIQLLSKIFDNQDFIWKRIFLDLPVANQIFSPSQCQCQKRVLFI